MGWVAVAMAVMSAAQQMQQGREQSKAASQQAAYAAEQQAMAERNAQREEAEAAEQQRRLSETMKREEARSRAGAAASGFASSGFAPAGANSIALMLADQQAENATQLDWEQRAGASRAATIRERGALDFRRGMAESSSMKSKSKATYWGAASSGIGAAQSGYNWWTKK
jgi:hypothetical protein